MELEARRRIYHHVVRHPGKYLRELQRDLDIAMGALEYHLGHLESAGLVTVLQDEHKRFFPAEMDRRDKRVLGMLRQRLPRRTLVVLLENGATTKAHLSRELDVAPSTLSYHLAHLAEVGLIANERLGREALYTVIEPDTVLRLLVAYRTSLLDRILDAYLEGVDALR